MTPFLIACGVLLAFAVVVLAWLFRTAAAPLWAKIVAPPVAIAAACSIPWAINALLGYPVMIAERDLPPNAALIAFVPHDEDKEVELWLIDRNAKVWPDAPRAYSTTLTANLKKVLEQAQAAIGRGERVTLERTAKPTGQSPHGAALGIGGDDSDWRLLIENPLPPK